MDKKTEENIIKCSRCGLCADVCPVYKAKHTEGALLRGKFLQLLGLIRGELKWSKGLKASIDQCLGCEKCKIQCPSGISATEIFEKVKYENLTPFEKFLTGKFILKIKIFMLKCFYRAKHPVKSTLILDSLLNLRVAILSAAEYLIKQRETLMPTEMQRLKTLKR